MPWNAGLRGGTALKQTAPLSREQCVSKLCPTWPGAACYKSTTDGFQPPTGLHRWLEGSQCARLPVSKLTFITKYMRSMQNFEIRDKHNEMWTKWWTYCRCYFRMHFLESKKWLILIKISTQCVRRVNFLISQHCPLTQVCAIGGPFY